MADNFERSPRKTWRVLQTGILTMTVFEKNSSFSISRVAFDARRAQFVELW
jgi:hypothetical protein